MSQSSKQGISRTSDDDGKTAVRVGQSRHSSGIVISTNNLTVVRVRPPLGSTDPGYDLIPQRFQRSMVKVDSPTTLGVDSPQGRKIFIFDRVFGEEVTQNGVWEYLQDSVDSFLQGYNVSILAYGQSGAGKSYTMGTSGPAEQLSLTAKGVIPRAAAHLFDTLSDGQGNHSGQNSGLKTPTRYSVGNFHHAMQQSAKAGNDKAWEMTVTYVEIYNEQPRDLLVDESIPLHERTTVQIREDTRGKIFVEGLRPVPVSSIEELMAALNFGSSIRQTDATAMNAQSSRSHAVFTINLRQSKPQGPMSPTKDKRNSVAVETYNLAENTITVESKLHFVDLAGSERLKNTGATGDRAKEGISINAGLASLGKVISQLSSRTAGHVSYRDSKLTRMLQDSLGGNAITYMIACVTPAEFHLSETLNTVSYAQRARNIQSKPKIQQISDDSDKQAVIDRLRAEVGFLRQQIRSAGGGDRRTGLLQDRSNEREVEMENHLLDIQESYGALSQRHAKLIAELAKSGESVEPVQIIGESAMDRLKRSQAHQAQIEQVVLEYEKTIQHLEANLSTTRSSLAQTESSLLEKETKCAYVETMNQQLNTRVQKLMDRENSTETYLHDLESRLADQSSGEEKSDAIIADLRKKVAELRESGTTAEEYISTLEERLGEADHDMEIMQREVDRLEQLVERQRSLGKLDNLLYELDHVQKDGSKAPNAEQELLANGVGHCEDTVGPTDGAAHAERVELPAGDADELEQLDDKDASNISSQSDKAGLKLLQKAEVVAELAPGAAMPSPAQSKFVAEKFESVNQELFDLKIEHEATINELDLMSAKYQQALRTLAEMQESFEDARSSPSNELEPTNQFSRPNSFLGEARMQELRNGGHLSSSRSLSSELSSVGESATSTDPSDLTPTTKEAASADNVAQEIAKLQALLTEHETNARAATEQYQQLQVEHRETLSTVDKLKSEVSRYRPASPNAMPGMLRRMASQTGTSVDRGQRSIVSLRTIMVEELDNKPDRMESAEVHLSAANHELQSRMDRIQALEIELKNVKKEMDMKSTIISGLTRERNSMKVVGSPVDLSMVSQMRDQLIQKETELKSLHEGYAKREQELQYELQALSDRTRHPSPVVSQLNGATEDNDRFQYLQEQLEESSRKHDYAQKSVKESEKRLNMTIAELETARASVETLKTQQATTKDDSVFARAVAATAMQSERANYDDLVVELKRDLEEQRSATTAYVEKISELEKTNADMSRGVREHLETLQAKSAELDQYKHKLSELEQQLQHAQSDVEFHKHGLKSLHKSHTNEIEEMKLAHRGQLASLDNEMANTTAQHDTIVGSLTSDLERAEHALLRLIESAQGILGHATSPDMLSNHIQDLVEEKKHISEANIRLTHSNAELERQLSGRRPLGELEEQLTTANTKMSNYQDTIRNLANEVGNHEETMRENEKIIRKHEKTIESVKAENEQKMVLIEELEQQLQNSFDQHHNRVSVIQAQGNQALVEAQQRIMSLEKNLDTRNSLVESDGPGSRTHTMKSMHRPQSPALDPNQRPNSLNSHLRKSASIASLPSPPPVIPLPPLPTFPGLSVVSPTNPSPPQSRHASKEDALPITPVSNVAGSTASRGRQSALIEEQEARIRTVEKHLHAEKQLTATLEEALVDLETQSNKLRVDAEGWKKKACAIEEELSGLRKERRSERLSVQAVEEEVKKRREAEAARAQLEERMRLLTDGGKKKRKGATLNCF